MTICASHDDLVAELEAELEAPTGRASARAVAWIARRRPWADLGCQIGECLCGSTVAVEDPTN